jgi:glycosyltransferase involved in cell wall biosynthesis/Flp pilus assembly protein TadD
MASTETIETAQGFAPAGSPGSAHADLDPVGEAVASGHDHDGDTEVSLRHALAEARDLLRQARSDGGFRASLPRALQLVREHPDAEALQVTAARLVMEDGDNRRALACWAGVHHRFPLASEPFRMLVRMTLRERGEEAAEALLADRIPDPSVEEEADLLALGFGLEEIGLLAEAEEAFRRAAQLFPRSPSPWRQLIRLQEGRGGLLSAHRSAAEAAAVCGGERFVQTHARLSREIQTLESFAPNAPKDDSPFSIKALQAILADVLRDRASTAPLPRHHLGSSLMVTGSLGSGGAERQLVTTVLSLNEAVREGRRIAGFEVAGPVAVACRSLSAKSDNDFFLSTLAAAGVEVTEYSTLEPFGGRIRLSRVRPFCSAIDFLPLRMKEGVTQLVDFLRYVSPDVVQIWQDGMVFAAGLAALMAGTPRIVLSARTLPPTDRANRWRRELEPIYRALLGSRGVIMTANSHLAARRYEEWLGLANGVVPVIHNGVDRLPEGPAIGDEEMWAAFLQRTADADFTLGGVMRLDPNKRPLEWLAVAERLHQRHPRARFVLVGEGTLREEAREFAGRLGISDRVLFTGRSASVGFWLAKMDALMLISRYEGTPNVLIEAQLAGVPVITTPAGGAAETVLANQTGFVLSSAERPDIDEAVATLLELSTMDADHRRSMGLAARVWAERSFSVEAMLQRTVEVFMSPQDDPMLVEIGL